MDHNLDDSLNLENAMVEFDDTEDTVVNQADITLDASGHEESIPMEFEHIEEQPILMETGTEEIIVSDFMGDQFALQEYSGQEGQVTTENTTVEKQENEVLINQSEDMTDVQYEHPISVPASCLITEEMNLKLRETIAVPASGVITDEIHLLPKITSVKASAAAGRQEPVAPNKAVAPRQVAIAPKPTKIVQGTVQKVSQLGHLGPGKQYAIAPKPMKPGVRPVALISNKQAGGQAGKGNTIVAIGKQLVMMPNSQKMKLLSAAALGGHVRVIGAGDDQAQLIQNVATSQAQGTKLTKVIVQGSTSDPSNQPAVITKLVSVSSAQPAAPRLVQAMPISIGSHKVVLASPTKSGGIKYTPGKKSQLIAIKSPTLVPATSTTPGVTTKKVVLTANKVTTKVTQPTTQKVILKAAPKPGTVTKLAPGQKSQLHQINVPGKGIQYIRLVTNPPPPASQVKKPPATLTPLAPLAPAPSPTRPPALVPADQPHKTFVLTDAKGNLIQMTAEKLMTSQPPPLLVTGSISSTGKVSSKPHHKLVRIAPVSSKIGQAAMSRGGQSLLAPLSPMTVEPQPSRVSEDLELTEDQNKQSEFEDSAQQQAHLEQMQMEEHDSVTEEIAHEEPQDSKSALRALIADTVGIGNDSADDTDEHSHSQLNTSQVEVEFERSQSQEYSDSNSSSTERRAAGPPPLIVIPPYSMKQEISAANHSSYENSQRMGGMINVEVDVGGPYDSYHTSLDAPDQGLSDTDMVPTELGLRPRKACNCTKSQCLKLYCDCFANGEFCNSCNCNNCHNNLENEELRQKAIRGCLDRNPNAFRPKIGKSKTGGTENFRRHNKGCNCKRSGCLKNYCECYEAKIACTNICKCVGCRNVEESLERARRRDTPRAPLGAPPARDRARPHPPAPVKQPCSFMTTEVIEAVCQCLIAAAVESGDAGKELGLEERDPIGDVIDEFARCLQDIISASHQSTPLTLFDEAQA